MIQGRNGSKGKTWYTQRSLLIKHITWRAGLSQTASQQVAGIWTIITHYSHKEVWHLEVTCPQTHSADGEPGVQTQVACAGDLQTVRLNGAQQDEDACWHD